MKHTIEGIIELALEDSDLWVKLVAGIIKTYPMTFNLNLDLRSSSIAQHVLQQVAEKGLSSKYVICESVTSWMEMCSLRFVSLHSHVARFVAVFRRWRCDYQSRLHTFSSWFGGLVFFYIINEVHKRHKVISHCLFLLLDKSHTERNIETNINIFFLNWICKVLRL